MRLFRGFSGVGIGGEFDDIHLKKGDSGPEVFHVQDRLRAAKMPFRYPDGKYDDATAVAVATFQNNHQVHEPDGAGNVGPWTWAVLNDPENASYISFSFGPAPQSQCAYIQANWPGSPAAKACALYTPKQPAQPRTLAPALVVQVQPGRTLAPALVAQPPPPPPPLSSEALTCQAIIDMSPAGPEAAATRAAIDANSFAKKANVAAQSAMSAASSVGIEVSTTVSTTGGQRSAPGTGRTSAAAPPVMQPPKALLGFRGFGGASVAELNAALTTASAASGTAASAAQAAKAASDAAAKVAAGGSVCSKSAADAAAKSAADAAGDATIAAKAVTDIATLKASLLKSVADAAAAKAAADKKAADDAKAKADADAATARTTADKKAADDAKAKADADAANANAAAQHAGVTGAAADAAQQDANTAARQEDDAGALAVQTSAAVTGTMTATKKLLIGGGIGLAILLGLAFLRPRKVASTSTAVAGYGKHSKKRRRSRRR